MSSKVAQLVRKLAMKSVFADDNEQFRQQRERLSKFYFEMNRKLDSIAKEMEGDLFTLKHKEFPKKELVEFTKIYQEVILLKKSLDPIKPYDSAQKVIDKINDRMFRAHITTLDVIIQHFLKKNEVDFAPSAVMQQVRVSSLHHLVELGRMLAIHMENNPLLPDPRTITTKPPPRPAIIEDSGFQPGTPEDMTNPGDKNRK
jgi:hypothetical protein